MLNSFIADHFCFHIFWNVAQPARLVALQSTIFLAFNITVIVSQIQLNLLMELNNYDRIFNSIFTPLHGIMFVCVL